MVLGFYRNFDCTKSGIERFLEVRVPQGQARQHTFSKLEFVTVHFWPFLVPSVDYVSGSFYIQEFMTVLSFQQFKVDFLRTFIKCAFPPVTLGTQFSNLNFIRNFQLGTLFQV